MKRKDNKGRGSHKKSTTACLCCYGDDCKCAHPPKEKPQGEISPLSCESPHFYIMNSLLGIYTCSTQDDKQTTTTSDNINLFIR